MRSRAKLARASAWLLALSTLLTAGLLIAQCIQIHEAGAFSREIVRARLEGLAWAGALWLALLAGTLLLRLPNGKESQLRAPITTSRSTGEDQSPVLAENREQRTAAQSSTEAAVEENPSQLLAENRGQMSTARSATEVVSEENRLHIRDGKRGRRRDFQRKLCRRRFGFGCFLCAPKRRTRCAARSAGGEWRAACAPVSVRDARRWLRAIW